jgi:hypothetical protein
MAIQINHHWVSLLKEVKKLSTLTLPRQRHCTTTITTTTTTTTTPPPPQTTTKRTTSTCTLLHLAISGADGCRHHLQITDPREFERNKSGEFEDGPPSRGRTSPWDVVMTNTDTVAEAVSANIKHGQSGKMAPRLFSSPILIMVY